MRPQVEGMNPFYDKQSTMYSVKWPQRHELWRHFEKKWLRTTGQIVSFSQKYLKERIK